MTRALTPIQFNQFLFNAIHQQNVKNYMAAGSANRSKKAARDSYKNLYSLAKEQDSVINTATASLERFITENNAMVDIDVLKAYNALKDFLESEKTQI